MTAPTASPSTLNFPDTVQQSASAPMTITFTNTGNLTAQMFGITPDGPFTVMVGDANSYVQLLYERKPHLTKVNNLDELFEICDAIAVMHNGHLSEPIPISEATYERIGLLMGGAEGATSKKSARAG